MTATLKVDTIKEVNSSVDNLVLDSSGNVTIGNNLTVTGTTTQTGSTTFTSQTLFPDGSVSAPSISNTGDVNTGVYFPAADNVAIATGGVAALTADSSQNVSVTNTLAMGSSFARNVIINGAMNVWQRGTSFSNPSVGSGFYTADRWGVNRAGDASGATVSRSTSAPTSFQYSMNLQRTAGNTSTAAPSLFYSAETIDSIRFAGKYVTLSFYAKAGANYSGGALNVTTYTGTGTDERVYAYTGSTAVINTTQAITTTWTRYTFTSSAATASNITEIGVYLYWTPTGTAGADDAVYLTGLQLEEGQIATPFEREIYEVTLAKCQRYFSKSFNITTAPVNNAGVNSGEMVFPTITTGANQNYGLFALWPVSMRVAPTTITFYAPGSTTAGQAGNLITNAACSATQAISTTTVGTRIQFVQDSGSSANQICGVHWTASAEL